MGWFGKSDKAKVEDDRVWKSGALRDAGVKRAVETLVERGDQVIVVAWSFADRETIAAALGPHVAVSVKLASSLPASAVPVTEPTYLLVVGRSDSRAKDDAIVTLAEAMGPKTTIAFHVALDDPLLAGFTANLGPILEALKAPDDEPIVSGMLTRTVRNAQEKRRG
jgi:hypothetical protein